MEFPKSPRKSWESDLDSSRMLIPLIPVQKFAFNFFLGTSDPYCEVSMGSQEHRTKVIPKDLNPKWNSTVSYAYIQCESTWSKNDDSTL